MPPPARPLGYDAVAGRIDSYHLLLYRDWRRGVRWAGARVERGEMRRCLYDSEANRSSIRPHAPQAVGFRPGLEEFLSMGVAR